MAQENEPKSSSRLIAKSNFRVVGPRCCAATHNRQVVRHHSEITFGKCYKQRIQLRMR